MTGPRIEVDADVSAITQALEDVRKGAERVTQALSGGAVGIDTKQAKQDLAELEAAAKRVVTAVDGVGASPAAVAGAEEATKVLEDAVAAADQLNKVLGATGSGSAGAGLADAAKQAKALEDQLRRAGRVQEMLKRVGISAPRDVAMRAVADYAGLARLNAMGARRLKQFSGLDDYLERQRGAFVNDRDAARHKADLLKRLGIDAQAPAASASPGAPGVTAPETDAHDPKTPSGRRAIAMQRINAMAGTLGGAIGATASGGDGGLVSAAGGTVGSGIGAGVGMLFGGQAGMMAGQFAGRALSSLGAGADAGLGRSENQAVATSDLRSMLGGVRTDYDELSDRIQIAARGLGVTNDEALKLARQFTHTANLTGDSAKGLASELKTATEFGRGFGVSAEKSTEFLADMRHLKVGSTEADSRRLALMVGEAVGKSGNTARTDEMLASIQQLAKQAASGSMSTPDVEKYTSMLSSLSGLKLPGMDIGRATSALSTANANFVHGGAFGEASQNYLLGVYNKAMPGFDARDMETLNSQGIMGTVRGAFGPESNAYKLAEKRGDTAAMKRMQGNVSQAGGDADTALMDFVIRDLRKRHGTDSTSMALDMKGVFGTDMQATMALMRAHDTAGGLGGLEQRIKRLTGQDVGGLDVKSFGMLAELQGADRSGLMKQADRLTKLTGMDAVKGKDAADLAAAQSGGNTEALRDVVMRLSATRDVSNDTGRETQRTLADVSNGIDALVKGLIPMTNSIREILVGVLRHFDKSSPVVAEYDRAQAMRKAVEQERAGPAPDDAVVSAERRDRDKEREAEAELKRRGLPPLQGWQKHRYPRLEAQEASEAERKKLVDSFTNQAISAKEFGDPVLDRYAAELRKQRQDAGYATSPPAKSDGTFGLSGDKTPGKRPQVTPISPELDAKLNALDTNLQKVNPDWLPGTARAQLQVESGFNPNATSPVGAMGIAQFMPKTLATWEKRQGRKFDPRNTDDALELYRLQMTENLRSMSPDDAMRAYNAGPDRKNWNNAETRAYAGKVATARGDIARPDMSDKERAQVARDDFASRDPRLVPANMLDRAPAEVPSNQRASMLGFRGADAQPQQVVVRGEFTLKDSQGQPVAAPLSITEVIQIQATPAGVLQ